MILTSSLKHVERNHGVVVEKHRLVGNDEPHPTHISGETIDMLASGSDFDAVFKNPKINFVELVAELLLFHELVFLPVCTNDVAALL